MNSTPAAIALQQIVARLGSGEGRLKSINSCLEALPAESSEVNQ